MDLTEYSLTEIMNIPLPPLHLQRQLRYRPSYEDVEHVYDQLNTLVYDSQLKRPIFEMLPRRRIYWGMCYGELEPNQYGSYCILRLMDKWFCPQWMVMILAHEMAHQYQWDIEGPPRLAEGKEVLLGHGPTFFKFRDKLHAQKIPLKRIHSMGKWFKYQDLFKT